MDRPSSLTTGSESYPMNQYSRPVSRCEKMIPTSSGYSSVAMEIVKLTGPVDVEESSSPPVPPSPFCCDAQGWGNIVGSHEAGGKQLLRQMVSSIQSMTPLTRAYTPGYPGRAQPTAQRKRNYEWTPSKRRSIVLLVDVTYLYPSW